MGRVKAVGLEVVINFTNYFVDRDSSDLYVRNTITGEKDRSIFISIGLKYTLDNHL